MKYAERSEHFKKWAAQSRAYEAERAIRMAQRTLAARQEAERRARRARLNRPDWLNGVHEVLQEHHVTLDQVRSPSRIAHICRARDHAMVFLRRLGWSNTRIGRFLNRDRTTVVYALRRAKQNAGGA